ncbi:hypothetical protein S245_055735, partial [Arachis hypogaea]
ATSGIGAETTRVLALRGVHVVMGIGNLDAAKDVKESILKEIPFAKVDAMELDLSSFESVKKFASEFNSSGLPLNILISNVFWIVFLVILRNNAEIMACPFMLSKDNIELQFATNHLGPADRILMHVICLLPCVCYNSWHAYGQSKLANMLHANELARCLKVQTFLLLVYGDEDGANITANFLHPGAITTNLFCHTSVVNGNYDITMQHYAEDIIFIYSSYVARQGELTSYRISCLLIAAKDDLTPYPRAVQDSVKLKRVMESDSALTEDLIAYNIIPLDAASSTNAIVSFPEVQAAVLALRYFSCLPELPREAFTSSIRNADMLDFLQYTFRFQVAMSISREVAIASRLGVEAAIVVGGRNFFCEDAWVAATGLERCTTYQIG